MQYCPSPAGNKSPVKVAPFISITIYLSLKLQPLLGITTCKGPGRSSLGKGWVGMCLIQQQICDIGMTT